MPLVTVASSPNGDPIATTFSPTAIFFDVLMVAGCRPDTPSALMTARSVTGSVPMTRAFLAVPSLKLTDISPCWPATEATWLLVRISPSELMMMPEPEPCSCALRTLIFTTEGSTDFATASTESAAGATCFWFTTGELVVLFEPPDEPLPNTSSTAVKPAAPTTPAIPPTTRAATRIVATTPAPGRAGRPEAGRSGSWRKPKLSRCCVSSGWFAGRSVMWSVMPQA